jgi:predicted transport protein
VVIIDQKTPETEEALQNLTPQPSILEFKTFARIDAPSIHAHLFEPLHAGEPGKRGTGESPKKRTTPNYYRVWEKKLEWVDQSTRDATRALMNRILQLKDVTAKASGPDYIFCKGQPSDKTRFVGLFLMKPALKVRVRTDPATTRDPKKWLSARTYNWLFRTANEKEFKISSINQIDYAMELIKQSYSLAE